MQASIAERFAFGRPYDPVAGDTVSPVVPRSATALIGRILISAIFILSAITKFADPAGTAGYMGSAGIPAAGVLVYVAAVAELAGGLSLLFGFLTRIGALGLIILVAIISFTFHAFWTMPAAEAAQQQVHFLKNMAIIGGLFMVVAMGPGRYSIDAGLRRSRSV